jgi:hypothetical protein
MSGMSVWEEWGTPSELTPQEYVVDNRCQGEFGQFWHSKQNCSLRIVINCQGKNLIAPTYLNDIAGTSQNGGGRKPT